MEEGGLAAGKSTAAASGAWIVFADEAGQSITPPRARTWGWIGRTPVVRVRGRGSGRVSMAGMVCYRPGDRSRLVYAIREYAGLKGQPKGFGWRDLRDLLVRARMLSATEWIAALQQETSAPGQLSAEFADVTERATTARLPGLVERALGPGRAAMFMAADAYPALIRALHDAERAWFDLPRLLAGTVPWRGFADADDPSAVLTWRLRERLKDAAEAQHDDRPRPLVSLTLAQLHTLNRLAASHRAVAREALKAADATLIHLPAPVTTCAGHTHPAWDQRPMGDLSRRELAAQLVTVHAQIRRAQADNIPLTDTARHVIADPTCEARLRRALSWRDAAARTSSASGPPPARPPATLHWPRSAAP